MVPIYVFMVYPHFNKRFDIHKDTLNYELSVVIGEEGKTIKFYSQNITGPQSRYRQMEN